MSSYLKVTRALPGNSTSAKINFTAVRGVIVQIDGASAAGKPGVFNPDVAWKKATGTKGFVLERDVIAAPIPLENLMFDKTFVQPDVLNASGITYVSAREVQEMEVESASGGDLLDASVDGNTTAGTRLTTKNGKLATMAAAADITFADGATTSGAATLTSATAAFKASDVGKKVTGAGIPAGTTILSRDSATQVTLSANATATATGVAVTIVNRAGSSDEELPGAEEFCIVRAQLAPLDAGNVRLLVEMLCVLFAAIVSGVLSGSVMAGAGLLGLMTVPLQAFAQSAGFGRVNPAQMLKELKARASVLQPATAMQVTAVLAQMEESLKDPEKNKKLQELIVKAREGDVTAQAQMARLRVISVDNFLLASTNPITFFDTVNLADDEVPYIENTSKQEITVSFIGQDGRARKTQGIKYQEQAQCQLLVLSTEEFEYQLVDIYTGEVKTASLANIDMAYDFSAQISKLMWPFVKAAIGPFSLTGPRSGRVYYPHSLVNVKNLPTTNLLVTPGNTTTTMFRKESMDMILKYCAAWGTDAFRDGMLRPAAVFIPSSEIMGFLDQVTLTSQPNTKVEEIFETGFVMTYGGVRWTFLADATLDPDEGLAYVKFNKGIGSFFRKPGMDRTFVDESMEMQKQNKGSVSMSKVVGWGLPITARVNAAAVLYHTAR